MKKSGSRWTWLVVALALGGAALASYSWFARRPRLNLLLVTIDTLRADHLGAYGYAAAATPVLDGIARGGVRFENAQSAAPLTGPSHATILTGQYPPQHGVRENVNFLLDPSHVTLATRLKRRGYHTGAFVGAYPVAAAFGFGQDVDHFSEGLHPNPGIGQGAERPANEVADAAAAWVREAPMPFFAWVHFYDPHAPYAPPPPFRERFADRPYDGEIAFTDAQLGRILDVLRAAGHGEDTLVIVLADHGEGLGEHDEGGHGILAYQSTLRVPLLVSGPGVAKGRIAKDAVGTIDVVPTVLALLGLDAAADLPGRSLRPALEGRALAPVAALRRGPLRPSELPLVEPPRLARGGLAAHRGRGARAVPPRHRPRREGGPLGRGAGARAQDAIRPQVGGGGHGAGRRSRAAGSRLDRADGAPAQPRLHGRRRRDRRHRRAGPARPAPPRLRLRTPRNPAERDRVRRRSGHPRDRRPSLARSRQPVRPFRDGRGGLSRRGAGPRREGVPAHARPRPGPSGHSAILRRVAARHGTARGVRAAAPHCRDPRLPSPTS